MNSSPISAFGVVFVVILLFAIFTINFFLIEILELFKFIFDIFVFGSFVNRDLSDDLSGGVCVCGADPRVCLWVCPAPAPCPSNTQRVLRSTGKYARERTHRRPPVPAPPPLSCVYP